jgi:hypothetical protein
MNISTFLALIAILVALTQRPIEILWDKFIRAVSKKRAAASGDFFGNVISPALCMFPIVLAAIETTMRPLNKHYVLDMAGLGAAFALSVASWHTLKQHRSDTNFYKKRFQEVWEELEELRKSKQEDTRANP